MHQGVNTNNGSQDQADSQEERRSRSHVAIDRAACTRIVGKLARAAAAASAGVVLCGSACVHSQLYLYFIAVMADARWSHAMWCSSWRVWIIPLSAYKMSLDFGREHAREPSD